MKRALLTVLLFGCTGGGTATSSSSSPSGQDPTDTNEICDDGVDNNGDGRIDCVDPSCDGSCPELCFDARDNDVDGLVDCVDPDCPACGEVCDGAGVDEDRDGTADCADPDCTASCDERCDNAVDDDADALVDCLDDECAVTCDADGDGYLGVAFGGEDCDDREPSVFPGAPDPCGDGIDGDCVDGDRQCRPVDTGSQADTADSGG